MEIYGIKDAADLIFSNPVTGEVEMILDYANSFAINTSAETQYATEKGSNAVAFSEGKEGTITLTTMLGDAKLFAMILGSEVVKTSGTIHKRESGEVKDGKFTLKETPVADSVCVLVTDQRQVLNVGETVSDKVVKVTDKEISFDPSYNGKTVKIYYLLDGADINEFTVMSNSTPKSYTLTAITQGVGKVSGEPKIIDMYYPKVTPRTNINLEFSATAPSEFTMELDVLKDGIDRLFVFKELN